MKPSLRSFEVGILGVGVGPFEGEERDDEVEGA